MSGYESILPTFECIKGNKCPEEMVLLMPSSFNFVMSEKEA